MRSTQLERHALPRDRCRVSSARRSRGALDDDRFVHARISAFVAEVAVDVRCSTRTRCRVRTWARDGGALKIVRSLPRALDEARSSLFGGSHALYREERGARWTVVGLERAIPRSLAARSAPWWWGGHGLRAAWPLVFGFRSVGHRECGRSGFKGRCVFSPDGCLRGRTVVFAGDGRLSSRSDACLLARTLVCARGRLSSRSDACLLARTVVFAGGRLSSRADGCLRGWTVVFAGGRLSSRADGCLRGRTVVFAGGRLSSRADAVCARGRLSARADACLPCMGGFARPPNAGNRSEHQACGVARVGRTRAAGLIIQAAHVAAPHPFAAASSIPARARATRRRPRDRRLEWRRALDAPRTQARHARSRPLFDRCDIRSDEQEVSATVSRQLSPSSSVSPRRPPRSIDGELMRAPPIRRKLAPTKR